MDSHDVTEKWAWVGDWLRDRAPRSHASLRPGASVERMAQAEQQLGFPLHTELRGLWSLNDGVSDSDAGAFLNGLGLLPLDVALETRAFLADEDPEWGSLWVPVTADEVGEPWSGDFIDCGTGLTGHWCMDEEPGMHGEFGNGLTLPGLVGYVVEALRAGTGPFIGRPNAPGLVDGALVWADPRDVRTPGWAPVHA
ncbi:SMI1/KNR4 family protein [Streptomyces sp. UC4497]